MLGAAIVRGYAGFGFSLLAITALSLRLAPAAVIPAIFMMEIAASIHMLPGVWNEVRWRAIGLLLLGSLIGTPLGVALLATVPVAPMKLAMGAVVLLAALLLQRGWALASMPGRAATFATGTASGLLNGAFGIGGPPVILFFFASPAGVAAGRASLVTYFLATDLMGLGFMLRAGMITVDHVWTAGMFLPALLTGVWLGSRLFRGTDPAAFRRWVLRVLMLLALLTAAQGASTLLRAGD